MLLLQVLVLSGKPLTKLLMSDNSIIQIYKANNGNQISLEPLLAQSFRLLSDNHKDLKRIYLELTRVPP